MSAHYGQAALAQRQALLAGLAEAEERLLVPLLSQPTTHLRVADLGCADGVNSFPVVAALRRRLVAVNASELSLVHVDLPSSDFNTLIGNLHEHPESYLQASPDGLALHPLLRPGSFYSAPLPEASVDFAFSTTALHYASAKAGPVTGHIDPLYARPCERPVWREQAERDCGLIMHGLARGLRPGGRAWLVVPSVLRDAEGNLAHWYRQAKRDLYEELVAATGRGVLDSRALDDFVIPTNERDMDEWKAWFAAHPDSWRLEYAAIRQLPNPYLTAWNEHRDNQRFAREYLASIKAWSERIVDSLIADRRQGQELFARLSERFAQGPTAYADDNVSIYLGLTRL